MALRRWSDLIAFVAGLALPLAFAPLKLFPLALVSPAILFLLWLSAPPGRAARYGFLFGLGLFGAGASWVYVTMHNFGNMSAPLAAFATFLFVAGLAAFYAMLGWVQARFFVVQEPWRLVLVLPALWVLFEWLRGWLFTGFPWLYLGYSQVATPLAGFAPWLGVFGISLATAVSAGLVLQGLQQWRETWWRYGLVLLLIWAGGWLAGLVQWVRPVDTALRVALVQANVPLGIKWQPGYRSAILNNYLQASREHRDADLIVWPEGAVPGYLGQLDPGFMQALKREAEDFNTDFLFGIVEREGVNNGQVYYNSVATVGSQEASYRKQHLVPFGEYPPLEPLFRWLLRSLHIPMSDFSAGEPDQGPLTAAGQRMGISICYEVAFGEEVVRMLPQASLLVNVSENAWYGDSWASHQLVQMARLRTIETGRPLLRVDNAGPSVVIDHRGRITAASKQFQQAVVTAAVQPMQGVTPYVRFGNWPILVLIAAILAGGWLAVYRRRAEAAALS